MDREKPSRGRRRRVALLLLGMGFGLLALQVIGPDGSQCRLRRSVAVGAEPDLELGSEEGSDLAAAAAEAEPAGAVVGEGSEKPEQQAPDKSKEKKAAGWERFEPEGDADLEQLRYRVYRAELEVRLMRAEEELQRLKRRQSGEARARRMAEKETRPKVVAAPAPKVEVIAMDPLGVTVRVDGEAITFARPGQTVKGVTFEGVDGRWVSLSVQGRAVRAKF